ncbi:hypothetical protein ACF0H5_022245 [Mactra antiquata]
MSEQFSEFLEFCEENLPSSKASLFLMLMKKRYKECDLIYKNSDTFSQLLVDTEAKITMDKGRIFVYILEFLETLKTNESVGSNKRGIQDSSSEADSDVNPSKKRKLNQERSSNFRDQNSYADSESEDNDSKQSSSKVRISNKENRYESDSAENNDSEANSDSDGNNDSKRNNGSDVNDTSDVNSDSDEEDLVYNKDSEVNDDSDENNDDTSRKENDDEREQEKESISVGNENMNNNENTSIIQETNDKMYSSSEDESDSAIKTNKHIADFIHSTKDDDDGYGNNDNQNDDAVDRSLVNENDDNDDINDNDNSEMPTETESTLPDISENGPTKDPSTHGSSKDISVEYMDPPECMNTSNDEVESIDDEGKSVPSDDKSGKHVPSSRPCIEKSVSKIPSQEKDLKGKCNNQNGRHADIVEIYVSDSGSESEVNDSKLGKTKELMNESTKCKTYKEFNDENKAPKKSVDHSGFDCDREYSKKNERKLITSSDEEDPEYVKKAKKFREKCKKKYVVCTGSKKRKNVEQSTSPPVAKGEKKQKMVKSPRKNKGKRSPKKSSPSKSPIIIVTDSDSSEDYEVNNVKRKLDEELASKFEEENDIGLNSPVIVLNKVKTSSLEYGEKPTDDKNGPSDEIMECDNADDVNDSKPSEEKDNWQVVDTESTTMVFKKRVNFVTIGKVDEEAEEVDGNIEKPGTEANSEESDHAPEESVNDEAVETNVVKDTERVDTTDVNGTKRVDEEEPGPSTSDAGDQKKKASAGQIRKLEQLLEKIRDQIEDVRTRELSVDDLESDISDYILEDKLQRKFMKVWDKLCELHHAVKTTGRPTDKYFRYQGTRYPDINRKVEKFINKKKMFPDYHDIRNIITKVNKDKRLHIRSREVDDLSKEVFTDVGNQLQKRRQKDFISTFHMPGAEVNAFSLYDDPALYDRDLKKKLDTNKKVAKTKMEQVVEKYAQLQYEVDDKTDEEEDDDDDDNDDDNLDSNTGIDDIENLISGVDNSDLETVDDKLASHVKSVSDDKKRSDHDIHDPDQINEIEKTDSEMKRALSTSLPLHRIVKSESTRKQVEEQTSKSKSFHEQLGLGVKKKETTITILSDDDDDNEIKLDKNCQAPADARSESDKKSWTLELDKTSSGKSKTSVDITIITDNEEDDDDDGVTQEPLELKIRNFRHVSLDQLDKVHKHGISDSEEEDEEIVKQSSDESIDCDEDLVEESKHDYDSNDIEDEAEGLPDIDVYIDKDHSFEDLPTVDDTDVTCVSDQINLENDVVIIENSENMFNSAKCVNKTSISSAKCVDNSSLNSAEEKDKSNVSSAKYVDNSGVRSVKYVNNSNLSSAKFKSNSHTNSPKSCIGSAKPDVSLTWNVDKFNVTSAKYLDKSISSSSSFKDNFSLSSVKSSVSSAKSCSVSSKPGFNSDIHTDNSEESDSDGEVICIDDISHHQKSDLHSVNVPTKSSYKSVNSGPKDNNISPTPDVVFVESDVTAAPSSVALCKNSTNDKNDITTSKLVTNEENESGTCTVSTEIEKDCLMDGEAEVSTQTSDHESGVMFTATLLEQPIDIGVNTSENETCVKGEIDEDEAIEDSRSVSDIFASYESEALTGNVDSQECNEQDNEDNDDTLEDMEDDLDENEATESGTIEFESGENEAYQNETIEFETGESVTNQEDTEEFEAGENEAYQNETMESDDVENETIKYNNVRDGIEETMSNTSTDNDEPLSEQNDQLNNTSSCDLDTIAGVSIKHPNVRNKLLKQGTGVPLEPIPKQCSKQISQGTKQSTKNSQVEKQKNCRNAALSESTPSWWNELDNEHAELIENYQEPDISRSLKSSSNFDGIIILSDSE